MRLLYFAKFKALRECSILLGIAETKVISIAD